MKTKNEEILELIKEIIKKSHPDFTDMVIRPIGRMRTMRNILMYYDIDYRHKQFKEFHYWMDEYKKFRVEKIIKIQRRINEESHNNRNNELP